MSYRITIHRLSRFLTRNPACLLWGHVVWSVQSWNPCFEGYTTLTIHKGVLYLASPISLFILQRWPHLCRMSSLAGLAISVAGLLSSSFATQVWQLIVTQGIIYPIGACMLYYPVLIFIDEWFVQKKGFAYGVCWV